MTAIIAQLIVSMLTQLLPLIGSISSGGTSSIITLLEKILPIAVQEAMDLVQPIQNIIAAIQGNGTVTADQVAQLVALSTQIDAAFDAQATADGLEAPPAPTPPVAGA